MANAVTASSRPFIAYSTPAPVAVPKGKTHFQISIPKLTLPKLPKTQQLLSVLSAAAVSFVNAPPSLAGEVEKASLFDFNLTLPIIAAEFLLLMFVLDKIYYTPLGNFMDERDAKIRASLSSVKDTSAEVKQLEEQAAAVMKAARAEISAALNKMKKETQIEVEQKLAEGRAKVEAELLEALSSLDKQKEETIKALDSQIAALSEDIVKKVLPVS